MDEDFDYNGEPILQMIGLKNIGENQNDCYRMVISDGKYSHNYCMLSIGLNHLVVEGKLSEKTVIRLKKYKKTLSTNVKNKNDNYPVLLIINLQIIMDGKAVGLFIGSPNELLELNNLRTILNESLPTLQYENQSMDPPPAKKPKIAINFINDLDEIMAKYVHWKIKPRVTFKSPMRYWQHEQTEGKFFTADLIDEDENNRQGHIRLIAYNDMADKFYEKIQVIIIASK